MMNNNEYVCTKENPWAPGKLIPVRHPEAKLIRTREDFYDGCDLEDYECPHCKTKWTEEIAR